MTGNVSITQPMDLGISIIDNISTGIFFTFINPAEAQSTGLCVKISKDEIYDLFVNQKKTINELAEYYDKKKNFIVEVLQFYDINQKERKLDISYKQLYSSYTQ